MPKSSSESDEDGALHKVRRHVRILVDLGKLAGANAGASRFLDQAVNQIARAVEIHHVKILQYRPRTSDLLLVAGVGWKQGAVGSTTLSSDLRSPPGRAYRTAEPVIIKDIPQQAEFEHSDFLKEHGIVSLANVPVLVDGTAWGVLEVDSTTSRDFAEDSIEFLSAAGALVGTVLRLSTLPDDHARLLAAAAEAQSKETLLREMQHRIKNNFQLVLSSISLQKRRHSAGEVHRALDHVASRINAISLAHDQLSPRHDGQTVQLADYIRALCSAIRQQAEEVEVDVETDEVGLSIDRALPVGLILNEAAMNSIRHAFGSEGGRIRVTLVGGIGYGEARLTISDNGKGIQAPSPNGSGLKLIAALARQIGGTIDQKSVGTGVTISLTFPVIG